MNHPVWLGYVNKVPLLYVKKQNHQITEACTPNIYKIIMILYLKHNYTARVDR